MANPHLFCKHWRILVRDFANARGMVVRIQAALPIRNRRASRRGAEAQAFSNWLEVV